MVGDFDEIFQEFDVCNAISTLAYCFFKLYLRSLVGFILGYIDVINGLEMKSDLYLSYILERCEAFGVPRSPIRVHGRRLRQQLSTQKTKICQFLQTQFANIIKPSNLRHSVIISWSNNRGLLANVILENAYSTFVCVSWYHGVYDSEENLLFIKATMGMDPENQFQI